MQANTFYNSEKCSTAKAVRKKCSDTDLVIAEDVTGYHSILLVHEAKTYLPKD